MFVVSELGGLVNLDLYDQVPIVATEPTEVEGVANLGAKRAVVARKAYVQESNGEVVYLSTVLVDGLTAEESGAVMRHLIDGLKKSLKVLDLQVFILTYRDRGGRNAN